MTAEPLSAVNEAGESSCWCCGQTAPDEALVRLGNHPEVGICIRCVRFLSRRAKDYQASVLRKQLRGAAESIRHEVMNRGWHDRPVIGPAIRWINQRLPW